MPRSVKKGGAACVYWRRAARLTGEDATFQGGEAKSGLELVSLSHWSSAPWPGQLVQRNAMVLGSAMAFWCGARPDGLFWSPWIRVGPSRPSGDAC